MTCRKIVPYNSSNQAILLPPYTDCVEPTTSLDPLPITVVVSFTTINSMSMATVYSIVMGPQNNIGFSVLLTYDTAGDLY